MITERSLARDWCAVLFALVLPTFVTLAYFVWAEQFSQGLQQVIYVVAKIFQFSFPLLWVYLVQRRRPQLGPLSGRGVPLGIVFGAVVLVTGVGLYHGWLKSTEFFMAGVAPMQEKIASMGFDSAWMFIGLGVFYSLFHSLLEEYYWRWFVFDQLRRLTPLWVAIVISSLGFMAHHVLVIGAYFGMFSPATWLFSLAVAMGGAFWAWLYHNADSLSGPWFSHLLIDAAIFVIGYDIASGIFS